MSHLLLLLLFGRAKISMTARINAGQIIDNYPGRLLFGALVTHCALSGLCSLSRRNELGFASRPEVGAQLAETSSAKAGGRADGLLPPALSTLLARLRQR